MARKPDPKSAAGLIRSLPRDLSASDVVATLRAKGVKTSEGYVHSVRAQMNATKKRGRGRPSNASTAPVRVGSNGVVAEIERIVERKVAEILRERLRTLV